MAEPPSRSKPTEFTEPGNMGFGTDLVSPGDLYEQAQRDAENTWRQGVLERKDYTEEDLRGHKLWTQNARTGEMDLAPDRYLELPVGTSDVEVQLAIGGSGHLLGVAAEVLRTAVVRSSAAPVNKAALPAIRPGDVAFDRAKLSRIQANLEKEGVSFTYDDAALERRTG
jgi:hypothetical protein